MSDFFNQLFSNNNFMPHGHCYLWNPALIWLHVVSDGLIALSYYSIPITLVYFVSRRKDVEFDWIYISFAIFILSCGMTHLMEIWNIWHPDYWLSGLTKALTAVSSLISAVLLIRLMPKVIVLPSPRQLKETNEALQCEIHEHKKASEAVQKLNQHLRKQAALLEAANDELEAFSYSVSHDLRAPLRHIDGFIDLLKSNPALESDPVSRRHMDVISNSARKMSQLIDDLLEFSRLGRSSLQPIRFEMRKLVDEAIHQMEPETRGRKIFWKIGELPSVEGDPALLRQVWINLISNAVKYTQTRFEATIEIGRHFSSANTPVTDDVVFYVRDNGVGFDMRYASKLFGVFQRLHNTQKFEGTGIGLASVQRILHRHGGRCWAEGQVEQGATFYFCLPKKQPESAS
ncbi:MAG: ATP-binding protein [Methylacidiphilales bacterium]|nr:ATP-binding protein [Candidatus Methylacidiphilales bacterium]